MTCPLDVVKTRIQTQLDPSLAPSKKTSASGTSGSGHAISTSPSDTRPMTKPTAHFPGQPSSRQISTSGPSTSLRHHGGVVLNGESVIAGLRDIYKAEGLGGWFRGVGPRFVWTSVQSGTMLVMYQTLLKWFDAHPLVSPQDDLR